MTGNYRKKQEWSFFPHGCDVEDTGAAPVVRPTSVKKVCSEYVLFGARAAHALSVGGGGDADASMCRLELVQYRWSL